MDPTEAFTECWHRDAPRLLAYARRHVGTDDASDVVADTFAIAWRRWSEVPDPPIGWLVRTAGGVIRNRSRGDRRRRGLATRAALLHQAAHPADADIADAVVRRDQALGRLAALSHEQREALLLVSWDGLSQEAAAEVLGLRPATFRKRLSRARELLAQDGPSDQPQPRSPSRATPLLSQPEMP